MKKIYLYTFGFALGFSLLFSVPAQARYKSKKKSPFYVEPYAGYFIGKVEGPSVADGDIKSYTVGARVGVELQSGLIFGIDYSQGKGKFERDFNGDKHDYVQKDMGFSLGYRVHDFIRVYGSYIFRYESEFEDIYDVEGDGYNAGLSISGIPQVKIGLEYQIRNLKENGGGTEFSGTNESTTYLLTLRLPLPVPLPFKIR